MLFISHPLTEDTDTMNGFVTNVDLLAERQQLGCAAKAEPGRFQADTQAHPERECLDLRARDRGVSCAKR